MSAQDKSAEQAYYNDLFSRRKRFDQFQNAIYERLASEARKRTLEVCGLLLRALKSVLPRNPTQLATLGSSP